jgi:stage V sporulation protein S
MREHKHAEVQAIGAGAVNQSVKALVLAKGYLAEDGMVVNFTAEFVDVTIEDKVRTAIKFIVDIKVGAVPPVKPPMPLMVQTPQTPEMNESPETPETPEMPETPGITEMPETPPETPETPETTPTV